MEDDQKNGRRPKKKNKKKILSKFLLNLGANGRRPKKKKKMEDDLKKTKQKKTFLNSS
jgi:hypothetical protein